VTIVGGSPFSSANFSVSGLSGGTSLITATAPAGLGGGSASATVNVIGGSADLMVTKTDSPDPVVIGDEIIYTIVVTNNGPDTAVQVSVTDGLSAPGTSVTTTQGTCDLNGIFGPGDLLQCSLGDIASGGSATVVVHSQTSLNNAGTVTNTVNVASLTPEPNISNNSATTTTTVNFPPEIAFLMSNYTASEESGTATITVVRGNAAAAATVNYSTSPGTATSGVDYTDVSGVLNFAIGQQSATFQVPLINDCTPDAGETVNLALTGASDGSPNDSATLSIGDSDFLQVNLLDPLSGPPGSTITINTAAYCPDATVTLGGLQATILINECGRIVATVPNLAPGVVDLQLSGCGDSVTEPRIFTVTATVPLFSPSVLAGLAVALAALALFAIKR
jgi:uncharacterized repeat protein (TIGR01451 family)